MHINIDNTLNGGENTRSGENTHTYPNYWWWKNRPAVFYESEYAIIE